LLSEAVVVGGDKCLHFVERIEVFENSVLEDGVELMLHRGEDGSRLETVEAHVFEFGGPVEAFQLKQFEPEENLGHAGFHLSLAQVFIDDQLQASFARNLPISRVEPGSTTLKSAKRSAKKCSILTVGGLQSWEFF